MINLFRKKLTAEEAMQALGISSMSFNSIHFVYLVNELNLTTTTSWFRRGLMFYEDEITKLRDSAHPALMQVRRNAQLERKALVKRMGYNVLLKAAGKEIADEYLKLE